jgi:hypothetical protein
VVDNTGAANPVSTGAPPAPNWETVAKTAQAELVASQAKTNELTKKYSTLQKTVGRKTEESASYVAIANQLDALTRALSNSEIMSDEDRGALSDASVTAHQAAILNQAGDQVADSIESMLTTANMDWGSDVFNEARSAYDSQEFAKAQALAGTVITRELVQRTEIAAAAEKSIRAGGGFSTDRGAGTPPMPLTFAETANIPIGNFNLADLAARKKVVDKALIDKILNPDT